jgi:hypothetical protein
MTALMRRIAPVIAAAFDEPDFCTWGQDRIWRVEEEIRSRLGEVPQSTP